MSRRTARPVAAALAACALLAACAQAAVPPGRLDPERVLAPQDPVAASNCTPRRRTSLPVSLPGLPLVAAEINGRPATLILDTGAESAVLTEAAARRLHVTTKYDFRRSMTGIGKTVQAGDARLDSFSLGGVRLSYPRALVGAFSLNLGGIEPDGLLGASLLGDFDLDLDLPRGRLTLYDRLDCPTLRPPWRGGYATLETTRSLSHHPFFPIRVNGHTLTATLDTGAQRTLISARAAAAAGVGADTALAGPELRTRGAAGETLPATLHLPRDLVVGGVPFRGPVLVAPVALPRDIDAVLGLDFLAAHRVWISYGSRRLFVAP